LTTVKNKESVDGKNRLLSGPSNPIGHDKIAEKSKKNEKRIAIKKG
jgi:hypothetical protein